MLFGMISMVVVQFFGPTWEIPFSRALYVIYNCARLILQPFWEGDRSAAAEAAAKRDSFNMHVSLGGK